MKLELFKDAVLKADIPEHRLKHGDLVRLVDRHTAPNGTKGFSIEVFNARGETVAIAAVSADQLEAVRADDVLCVRHGG